VRVTSDEYQIPIPPSFHVLHADARGRLLLPLAEFRARYELCEDMAQMLVEQAQALQHDQGLAEDIVLGRMQAGLAAPGAGLGEAEAWWVATRLAELLGWPLPPARA
jgi:hypothetical protein